MGIKRLLVCDRDGFLNVDFGYVYEVEKFQIPDGVVESLQLLKEAGFTFCIATGQSGIARGKYTVGDMQRFHDLLAQEYGKHGITFAAIAFCPHHPEVADCECRKPKTGMLDQIEEKLGPIDWTDAWGIGDKPADSKMILSKGGRAMLLKMGQHNPAAQSKPYWEETDPAIRSLLGNPRHFVANNALEAARIIKQAL
jgi:D-glycero-D-manno-heptose 1,7-bisphosphate phosphatase